MLGDTVDAGRALEIGLVTQVVPNDRLMETAGALASRLARGPRSLGYIKEALVASSENDLDAQLQVEERLQGQAASTADCYEGISAFLEKRPPRFTGR